MFPVFIKQNLYKIGLVKVKRVQLCQSVLLPNKSAFKCPQSVTLKSGFSLQKDLSIPQIFSEDTKIVN